MGIELHHHREPASWPWLEEGYRRRFLVRSTAAFAIGADYPRHLVSLEHGQATMEIRFEARLKIMVASHGHSHGTLDIMLALMYLHLFVVLEAVPLQLYRERNVH